MRRAPIVSPLSLHAEPAPAARMPPKPAAWAATGGNWPGGNWILEITPEQRRRRRRSFAISLGAQFVLAVGMAAALQWRAPRALPPAAPAMPLLLTFVPPPLFVPRPRRLPPPPPPTHAAPMPPTPVPPAPVVVEAKAPAPPQPGVPFPVHAAATHAPVSAPHIEAGAFGHPDGLPDLAATTVPAPLLGAFGATAQGAAAAPNPGVQAAGFGAADADAAPAGRGPARSAGFDNAAAADAAPAGRVQMHAFDATTAPARTESAQPPPPDLQLPQVLSLPSPAYTAAAEAHHIEGEVVLEVTFLTDGAVRLVRVVHGLGYGLDQAAVDAAHGVRFVPAQRHGQPVDWNVLLHVRFRLAY